MTLPDAVNEAQPNSDAGPVAPIDSTTAARPEADAGSRIWLKVRHDTTYDYDAPVELAHHMAHLAPRDMALQQVRGWRLIVDPAPDEWLQGRPTDDSGVPEGQSSVDSWGNTRVAFSHARVHERLQVQSTFEAGLLPLPEPDPANSPPWEEVAQALRYHAGAVRSEAVEFSLPSAYAPHDAGLAALGHEAFTPGASVVAGALALMQLIYERFTYEPNATSVATRAPEALAELHGVCQDFAHVMIGACRSLGLAARYVSGYLLTKPAPGQPKLVGADASHAWVQVWCPTQGWVALDPTNAVPAGTDHVTLAWGRDYADVAPLRGVIRGGGKAQPMVGVTVEPVG